MPLTSQQKPPVLQPPQEIIILPIVSKSHEEGLSDKTSVNFAWQITRQFVKPFICLARSHPSSTRDEKRDVIVQQTARNKQKLIK